MSRSDQDLSNEGGQIRRQAVKSVYREFYGMPLWLLVLTIVVVTGTFVLLVCR